MTHRLLFHKWFLLLLRGLLAIVLLLSVGRVYYLIDYRKVLSTTPASFGELLQVFVFALRFDLAAALALLLPALLVGGLLVFAAK